MNYLIKIIGKDISSIVQQYLIISYENIKIDIKNQLNKCFKKCYYTFQILEVVLLESDPNLRCINILETRYNREQLYKPMVEKYKNNLLMINLYQIH